MSKLRLTGSTSGYVELSAPATAGDNTFVLPTGDGTSGQLLQTDGSGNLSFTTVSGGATISDDTTTNSTYYPVFSTTTSGTLTTATVSSTKLTYNPSTGALSATSLSGTLAGSDVSGNISGNAANITAYTINQSVGTSNNVQFNSFGVGTAASGTAGEIRATNNITAYYSDDRLKERLGLIENAIDKVCSLTGFYYQANDVAQGLGYTAKREVGLSAQEVEQVLPEIVVPAPIDEQYKTLHYERLIPLLVEAIKEQQQQIEFLKEKIK